MPYDNALNLRVIPLGCVQEQKFDFAKKVGLESDESNLGVGIVIPKDSEL